jgi:hypothetical protein
VSDRSRRKAGDRPPISAHPAFPAIVALWFAALFGIGSMVLPIALVERFAVASGLSAVYESAQPPLGATARIALAVTFAALGLVAGLLVARAVARSSVSEPVSRRAAAMRGDPVHKRPLSAHEDIGHAGLAADDDPEMADDDAADAFRGRRRSLSVTDDSAPSEFLQFAPLPGQSPDTADEPLDLIAFDLPADAVDANAPETPAVQPEPEIAVPQPAAAQPAITSPAPQQPRFERQEFGRPEPVASVAPAETASVEPARPVTERAIADLGMVELVERFALALQRRAEPAPLVFPAARQAAAATPAPVSAPAAPEPVSAPVFEPLHAAPMPAALRPIGFDDLADEGEALPEFTLSTSLSLGARPFAQPAEAPALPAAMDLAEALETEDEDTADEGYTSLLAMKSPFGLPREPVRIEDEEDEAAADGFFEPSVVFPGQGQRPADGFAARDSAGPRKFDAPMDRARQNDAMTASVAQGPTLATTRAIPSGDTERALREALEKLQRLSGAA